MFHFLCCVKVFIDHQSVSYDYLKGASLPRPGVFAVAVRDVDLSLLVTLLRRTSLQNPDCEAFVYR